jgi:hypothetical protein
MPAWPFQTAQDRAETAIGSDDSNNSQATTNVAANRDGSVLERLEWNHVALTPVVVTGTTDIDDSAQTESTPYALLTIAPATGAPLFTCEVWLDLAKATTGFAAVESSATATFSIARKVDGTNWRRQVINEAALSGTLAASRMQRIDLGVVSVTEQARIEITMSADATADMEIPYAVVYRAISAPTITDVAAG